MNGDEGDLLHHENSADQFCKYFKKHISVVLHIMNGDKWDLLHHENFADMFCKYFKNHISIVLQKLRLKRNNTKEKGSITKCIRFLGYSKLKTTSVM